MSAAVGTQKANIIQPIYDSTTGKLHLLNYNSNGNGKTDTWSYKDGARVIRIEIDLDEAGLIDRCEYCGPDQKLQEIGFSGTNDGKQLAWSRLAGGRTHHHDGDLDATRRQDLGVEYRGHDALARAEEDTDGDGVTHKWETDAGYHLSSVAFDTRRCGVPDRRLISGSARVEVGEHGDGRSAPAPASAPDGQRES